MGKIGFACKWIDHADQVNGIKKDDDAKQYNTGTTTISWLNRQSKDIAEQKLWDLMVQNITATKKLVDRVGELNENLRMVRLSSDILPAYTEPTWSYFWRRPDVVSYLERNFILIGDSARASGTRVSMHPGQFVVLASINPGIVQRSIEEFEYHADMARYMGYGKKFQDFKINVHISGKLGPDGIRVNAVAPGFIKSGERAEKVWQSRNEQDVLKLVPLRERGEMEDISNAIIFLSSDASKYITGAILDINGGFVTA
jgi:hypothetical protein